MENTKKIETKWVDISNIDNLDVYIGSVGSNNNIRVNGEELIEKYYISRITWKIGNNEWNDGRGKLMVLMDKNKKVTEKTSKNPKQKIVCDLMKRKIISDNTSINTKIYLKNKDNDIDVTSGYVELEVFVGGADKITEMKATLV